MAPSPAPYPPVALPCPGPVSSATLAAHYYASNGTVSGAPLSTSPYAPAASPQTHLQYCSGQYSPHRPTLNATTFNPPYSYSFNYNNGHSAAPYVHFASNHSAHFVAPQAPASVALELTRCKTVNSRNPASSSSSWRSSSPWEIEG